MTKIALITGASRGLGAALALELSPTHHIVAVARTTGALEELDDRIKAEGGSATLAPMDICDEAAMATLCRGIYDRWGHVDLWAHCAIHGAALAPAHQIAAKDWERSVDVNLNATRRLIQFVEPLLSATEDGQAVFFDDPKGGERYYGTYGTTKAAQMALARSWQGETQKIGPKVNIVSPKPMGTALRARFHPGEDRAALASPADEAQHVLEQLETGQN